MWLPSTGGFETVALEDPLERFSAGLLAALRALSTDRLGKLSIDAGTASDRVLQELQALSLPPDQTNEYEWVDLPLSVRFDLPDRSADFDLLFTELDRIPVRWRLDAAMALEEGIDRLLDEREQ